MAEVDAPVPKSDAMEGVEATAEQPSAPPEDEYTCETLYIQNLNEKIKPEGSSHTHTIQYFTSYDVWNFNIFFFF